MGRKMIEERRHGLTGKPSNNQKSDEDKSMAFLQARCKKSDKAAWVSAAKKEGKKLTDWVTDLLNAAVKKD